MSNANTDTTGHEVTGQWLQVRKEAGSRIDPETAEVMWSYEQTLDPYGVDLDIPDEWRQVGREYFARSPGSEIWVWFGDLPEETQRKLWKMHGLRLALNVDALFDELSNL